MSSSPHFTDTEVAGLKQPLLTMLFEARDRAGVPFVITSGLRTPAQNAAAGGVPDSSHEKGLAVDIACTDSISRFKMIRAFIMIGFTRIGCYDRHVHVDVDSEKPQNVLWVGNSH